MQNLVHPLHVGYLKDITLKKLFIAVAGFCIKIQLLKVIPGDFVTIWEGSYSTLKIMRIRYLFMFDAATFRMNVLIFLYDVKALLPVPTGTFTHMLKYGPTLILTRDAFPQEHASVIALQCIK